jgi:hypothetical protein
MCGKQGCIRVGGNSDIDGDPDAVGHCSRNLLRRSEEPIRSAHIDQHRLS